MRKDRHSLHNQCFGVWKEQVKAEMERNHFTPHDILTTNWDEWHALYYSQGSSPVEAVIEEMAAVGL